MLSIIRRLLAPALGVALLDAVLGRFMDWIIGVFQFIVGKL